MKDMKRKTNKYGIFSECLRGNVAKAIKTASARQHQLTPTEIRQYKRLRERFRGSKDTVPIRTSDSLVRKVVVAYRQYYRTVLLDGKKDPVAVRLLTQDLVAALRSSGIATKGLSTLKKLEPQLQVELKKRGYHSLVGRILPFYSLSLWKTQHQKVQKVRLPETKATVRVTYISDLIEHGWMYYATLGKFYPGGWVPDEAKDQIFCVTKAYKNRPESLRVSLLAHETQHVVDLRRYPKLNQCELEYRAKLHPFSASIGRRIRGVSRASWREAVLFGLDQHI